MTTTRIFNLAARVEIAADLLADLGLTVVEKRISEALEFSGDYEGIEVGPVDLLNPVPAEQPLTTTELATLAELVDQRISTFRRAEVAHDDPADTVDEIAHLNEILTKLAARSA